MIPFVVENPVVIIGDERGAVAAGLLELLP
jgi:hypothetical protein